MGYSVKNLGSDILLLENLLEPETCDHLIEVAEFCQFEAATILIGAVSTEIRNNGILPLDRRNPIQKSANDLVMTRIQVIQEALLKFTASSFPMLNPVRFCAIPPVSNTSATSTTFYSLAVLRKSSKGFRRGM